MGNRLQSIAQGRTGVGSGGRRAAGAACGQTSGSHTKIADAAAAANFWGDPTTTGVAALPPQNGENTGPGTGSIVVRYTTTTQRKITKRRLVKAPIQLCPVQGKGYFSNDFGAPRYAGGYHPHAGNDIFAAMGTPVVAPFDGVAFATPNSLGGNAVKVSGPLGFVYNAHLIAYGKLGRVKIGDVIGYVGNTGDARGGAPHDHFEWHPGGGLAVNPYPFLKAACVP